MRTSFTNQNEKPADYPRELIEGCRKGDYRAQLQLYKLYYKTVFSICLQFVNDPVVAEDMMHESFLLAFENIDSYIGDINFSAWVKNYIKNTSYYGNHS